MQLPGLIADEAGEEFRGDICRSLQEVNEVENQNISLSQWNKMFFRMASLLLLLADRQEDTKRGPPLKGKLELITTWVHLIKPFSAGSGIPLSAITDLLFYLGYAQKYCFLAWPRYGIIAIFMKHLYALLYTLHFMSHFFF